jgi:hypothetical protein
MRVEPEFVDLCKQILQHQKTEAEWAEVESDDMFQSEHYEGGFDATENAFCFSQYAADGTESWFQLTLEDVQRVVGGELAEVDSRQVDE